MDDDTRVVVSALRACTALIDNGRDDEDLELEHADIHRLARMIFDEDRTVRREAARFIRACNHLFLPEDVADDEEEDEDEDDGTTKRGKKKSRKRKKKTKKRGKNNGSSSSSSAAALAAARARDRQRHRSKRQLRELSLMVCKMASGSQSDDGARSCGSDPRILARKIVDAFWPLASAAEGATGLVDWEAMVELAIELAEAAGGRDDNDDDEEEEEEEDDEDEDEEAAAERRQRRKEQAEQMPRISVFLACECMRKACGMGEYDDEDGSKAATAFRTASSSASSATAAAAAAAAAAMGPAVSAVPAALGGRLRALLPALKSADKRAVVQRSREGFSSALARGGALGSMLSLYGADAQCASELCEIVQIADGAVLASAAAGKRRGGKAAASASAAAAAAAVAAEVADARAAGVKGASHGGTGSTGHDGSDLRYAVDRSMAYVDGALVLMEMDGDGNGDEYAQCLLAARTLPRPAMLNAARAALLPARGLNILGGDGGRENGPEGDALADACAALAALAAVGGAGGSGSGGVEGNKRKRKVGVRISVLCAK